MISNPIYGKIKNVPNHQPAIYKWMMTGVYPYFRKPPNHSKSIFGVAPWKGFQVGFERQHIAGLFGNACLLIDRNHCWAWLGKDLSNPQHLARTKIDLFVPRFRSSWWDYRNSPCFLAVSTPHLKGSSSSGISLTSTGKLGGGLASGTWESSSSWPAAWCAWRAKCSRFNAAVCAGVPRAK